MARIDGANGFVPVSGSSTAPSLNETTTVRLGENTLSDVAQRLGLDADHLRQANPHLCDTLKVGQEICLPGKTTEPWTGPAGVCEHGQHHEPHRGPIGDPFIENVFKMLLSELEALEGSRCKQPIDADRISFGRAPQPIDADKISFGPKPIDADRISFGQTPQPIDADKISFGPKPIDADKISFGNK